MYGSLFASEIFNLKFLRQNKNPKVVFGAPFSISSVLLSVPLMLKAPLHFNLEPNNKKNVT